MKLESKLGLSTGFLIIAMLLSAYTAHMRIQEANHLSDVVTTNRLPIIMASREASAPRSKWVLSCCSLATAASAISNCCLRD